MLYKFFNSIKTLLVPVNGSLRGDVEWFNDQYSANIPKAPVIYIEFPESLEVTEVSKELHRAVVTVRMHVVSKVITKVNNTVPDAAVIEHESIAIAARDCLRGMVLTETVIVTPATESEPAVTQTLNLGDRLRWIRWQHFHKYNGWMLTYVDLTFRTSSFD